MLNSHESASMQWLCGPAAVTVPEHVVASAAANIPHGGVSRSSAIE